MININNIQALTVEGRKQAIVKRITDLEAEVEARASDGYSCLRSTNVRFADDIIRHFTMAGFKSQHTNKGTNLQDYIEIWWG